MIGTMQADQITNSGEAGYLRQFLRWALALAVGLALFYSIAGATTGNFTLALCSVVMVGLSSSFGVALWLLRRSQLQVAITLTSTSLLIITVCYAIITPVVMITLVVCPFIAATAALPYLNGRALRVLLVLCWATILASFLLTRLLNLADELPSFMIIWLQISGLAAASFCVLLLIAQYKARLIRLLSHVQATNAALVDAQAGLEAQVAARTAELRQALTNVEAYAGEQVRLATELVQQRAAIRELSVPILPVARHTLVMPLIGVLDAERLQQAQARALHAIEHQLARRLLLDITGVPLVDDQVARGLVTIAQAARLLGAEVVVIGVRPEAAQALVSLGIDLSGLRTASDLAACLTAQQ